MANADSWRSPEGVVVIAPIKTDSQSEDFKQNCDISVNEGGLYDRTKANEIELICTTNEDEESGLNCQSKLNENGINNFTNFNENGFSYQAIVNEDGVNQQTKVDESGLNSQEKVFESGLNYQSKVNKSGFDKQTLAQKVKKCTSSPKSGLRVNTSSYYGKTLFTLSRKGRKQDGVKPCGSSECEQPFGENAELLTKIHTEFGRPSQTRLTELVRCPSESESQNEDQRDCDISVINSVNETGLHFMTEMIENEHNYHAKLNVNGPNYLSKVNESDINCQKTVNESGLNYLENAHSGEECLKSNNAPQQSEESASNGKMISSVGATLFTKSILCKPTQTDRGEKPFGSAVSGQTTFRTSGCGKLSGQEARPDIKIETLPGAVMTLQSTLTDTAEKAELDKHTMRYECSICHTRFELKKLYTLHMKMHNTVEPSGDSKSDGEKAGLKKRMKTNTASKSFPCNVCGRQFKKESSLKRHKRVHLYNCPVCRKSFVQKIGLYKHFKKYHPEEQALETQMAEHMLKTQTGEQTSKTNKEKSLNSLLKRLFEEQKLEEQRLKTPTKPQTYECSICELRFEYKKHLTRHVRIHKAGNLHYCSICMEPFREQADLDKHMEKHVERKEATSYRCSDCGASFSSKDSFMKHIKTHDTVNLNKNEEMLCSCSDCNETFEGVDTLMRHRKVHHPENLYSCSVCGKQFSAAYKLDRHKKIHSEEKPCECSTCNKKFANKSKLKKHIRMHNDVKPHLCSLCGKRFMEASILASHMNIHSGEKRYQCFVCSKKFTHLNNWKVHIKIHSDVKPELCSICGKRFRGKAGLKSHMLTHEGKREHECSVCKKSFVHKHYLISHMRVHDGRKQCSICNQVVLNSVCLRTHMRLHHEGKQYKKHECPICGKFFPGKFKLNRHLDAHSRKNNQTNSATNSATKSGKKLVECSLCGIKFSSKASVKRHIMRKHNEEKDSNTLSVKLCETPSNDQNEISQETLDDAL